MKSGNNKDNLFNSWKEIATYLECDRRTAIRWEKSMGLPIHRMGGTSKSRIFAYKNELDEWLKNQLSNNKDNDAAKHLSSFLKPGIIVLPVLAILIGIYFVICDIVVPCGADIESIIVAGHNVIRRIATP